MAPLLAASWDSSCLHTLDIDLSILDADRIIDLDKVNRSGILTPMTEGQRMKSNALRRTAASVSSRPLSQEQRM